MRTLAIGDIHGYRSTLERLLATVQPTAEDTIVTLGDYVDRGPDSRGVIDQLITLQSTGRLIPVLGNHDEMMLEGVAEDGMLRWMWLQYGGVQTLESYGLFSISEVEHIPEAHLNFLRTCQPSWETGTHLFAHATVNPLLPLDQQTADDLRWNKLDGPIRHYSGKTLICGHTRQLSGRPFVLPGVICIDTAVYENEGWLTCLWVETGQYWQANERGETRQGTLEG